MAFLHRRHREAVPRTEDEQAGKRLLGFELRKSHDTGKLFHEGDIPGKPPGTLARTFGIEVRTPPAELFGVRVRLTYYLPHAGYPERRRIRVIDEHAVPRRHIAKEIARLVVPYAPPLGPLLFFKIIDRKGRGFGL